MAYSFKKKENIGNTQAEYSRYYAGFRGVDFSHDHTQVSENRLAYLVNMYKDYQSGQGEALETIPGFRKRADFSRPSKDNNTIYGVFHFKKGDKEHVLVHCGNELCLWNNYPYSVGVPMSATIQVSATGREDEVLKLYIFEAEIDFPIDSVNGIIDIQNEFGQRVSIHSYYNDADKKIYITSSVLSNGERVNLTYREGLLRTSDTLYSDMNEHKSTSFICNNRLYIMDGKNYLVYDGETVEPVMDNAYVPTTYINIIPSGENANIGTEYEQRNILTPKFKHTFIGDGTTKTFYMNEKGLDKDLDSGDPVISVKVYGEELEGSKYTVDVDEGKITLKEDTEAPKKPEDAGYEKGYAGIEITASKKYTSIDGVTDNMETIAELITNCTLCTTFDGKVFVTGNPKYPNHVFYCGMSSGYTDPSYFGVLNYMQDGVGSAPITGIMSVSNTLMVLKSDTQQDSSVYFHYGMDTEKNILPRIYPSEQGLSGLGCVGSCVNFLDDPIFISQLGVEGVSQLKIASERTNEHRSSLVDAKLVNTDLSKACLAEWGGYLCVLVDGKIFLADSRQRYQDATGAMQYEWFYLEDIGVWDGQYQEYTYSTFLPNEFSRVEITHEDGSKYSIEIAENVYDAELNENVNLLGTTANTLDGEGKPKQIYATFVEVEIGDQMYNIQCFYVLREDKEGKTHAYLCESKGNYIGGTFKPATILLSMKDKGKDNLFFGTENGWVCSFNFDQRDEYGEIPASAYHFDNRTIFCGCATLMDNCQIPHLTKNTVKRSTVIKTKSFKTSVAKVKVRTNQKPYEQIARINSSLFSFNDMNFTDFTFITTDQSLFAVNEKEKRWVEKQYFIYSDEYLQPFSLYYISYRYKVAGKYKNQ